QARDTWQSIALRLYGSADVALRLANALGYTLDQFPFQPGDFISGMPAQLADAVAGAPRPLLVDPSSTFTVHKDGWASRPVALCGSADAASALAQSFGWSLAQPFPFQPGEVLSGFSSALSQTTTTTWQLQVDPASSYVVQQGDTWQSIALALYGSA